MKIRGRGGNVTREKGRAYCSLGKINFIAFFRWKWKARMCRVAPFERNKREVSLRQATKKRQMCFPNGFPALAKIRILIIIVIRDRYTYVYIYKERERKEGTEREFFRTLRKDSRGNEDLFRSNALFAAIATVVNCGLWSFRVSAGCISLSFRKSISEICGRSFQMLLVGPNRYPASHSWQLRGLRTRACFGRSEDRLATCNNIRDSISSEINRSSLNWSNCFGRNELNSSITIWRSGIDETYERHFIPRILRLLKIQSIGTRTPLYR